MPSLLNSYLRYARGRSGDLSPWALLNVFGWLVRPFLRIRNGFYNRGIFCSMDPPLPVISVGNLCHGGTNKTPMVEMIALELKSLGLSVGVVSRGYGGKTETPIWVGQDKQSSDRGVTGDEPLMLAKQLPGVKVVVSPDRYKGVRLLRELGADVVVADDAFQHRRMGRDLDIVLVDATCPFGTGRLFPAGTLREQQDSLSRADIVILTKVEQAKEETIRETKRELAKWISPDRIFTARVGLDSWMVMEDGELLPYETEWGELAPGGKMFAFSAIGSPDSFYRSLSLFGMEVLSSRTYRDHHRFTWKNINEMERMALELGATGFVCTEKDLCNMPDNPSLILPLYIPRIAVSMDDAAGFWKLVTELLRPSLIVASNGYGEDAIGALLASRIAKRFPSAEISAFTLVGSGGAYRDRGIKVVSPPSEMPSGGIVKYSLRALLGDLRHGLRQDIKRQIAAWRSKMVRHRTPICVGDVYLLMHTLWGQGLTPLLVATAKSVRLSGHRATEKFFMRHRCRKVWTRDAETADDLLRSNVNALFCGNPIMDLALEDEGEDDPWDGLSRPRIMLLPGSRKRAYEDVVMLLDAVSLISERKTCSCVMVLASSIDRELLLKSIPYDCDDSGDLTVGRTSVRIVSCPVASVAYGADILIGLGGTANQVSAGMGVPVVSIVEKGKLVQKKLLREAEILTKPTAEDLAETALSLLDDPLRMSAMSLAGISLMGGAGTSDSVAEYAAAELGWSERHRLFEALSSVHGERHIDSDVKSEAEEVETAWKIPMELSMRAERIARTIRKVRAVRLTV